MRHCTCPIPLERLLFALAGTVTILSVVLSVLASPWFLLLTVFVAANQWAYAVWDDCIVSLLLRRACPGERRPA